MTDTPTKDLLEKGIALAKAGKKADAHELLLELVGEIPDNETCWLWLAISAPSISEQIGFLQQALVINPSNMRTQKALEKLEQKRESLEEQEENNEVKCPFCSSKIEDGDQRCSTCHAFLTLDHIDAILENSQADRPCLENAIDTFEDQLQENYNPEIGLLLSIAYLNLNQLDKGLSCLKDVLSTRRGDVALRLHYQDLQNKQLARSNLVKEPVREQKAEAGSVMIIDDSPTIRKLVSTVLSRKNYDVWEVKDGMEALSTLNDRVPDLILLDINMPRMDGYQVCKLIRNFPATQHVTIIMLSGNDGFFDKIRGKVAGADQYITKPFDPETLIRIVAEYT